MKSLYGLCEYGISIHTVRFLKEKNITPQMLIMNPSETLSGILGKNSKKKNEILKILRNNKNVFETKTLYQLDLYGLSISLIEKMIQKNIDVEELKNISKYTLINRYGFGDVISNKIMNSINKYNKLVNGERETETLYGLCEQGISIYTVKFLKEKNITPQMLKVDAENILSSLWNENSKKMKDIVRIIENHKNIFEAKTLYQLDEYGLDISIIKRIIQRGIKIEDIENLSKDILVNQYKFGNATSDKIMKSVLEYRNIMTELKEDEFDYADFLLNHIKKCTEHKTIEKYILKKMLINETKYPIERFESDIEKLKKQGKIEELTNGIRYRFPTLKERIEEIKKENYREILLERFSGETLDSIGKKRNVTRERIRQIISNACSKIGSIYEEKYLDVFCKYNFDKEEFKILFGMDDMVYYYFKELYRQGELDVFEYLKNNSVSKEQEEKIYKKYNTIFFMGERVKLNKLDIINIYLKNLKELTNIEDIQVELNKVFTENGLEEHNLRALEAILDRSNYVIGTINRRYRSYNLENIDTKVKSKLENMLRLERGYYSTLMLFNTYKDLLEEIDIRDEYELHNIIRKIVQNSDNLTIERMPNFIIGNIDKKQFFYNEILKYAPINMNDFLDIMEKEYGHKQETLKTYIQKEFSYNLTENTLIIEYAKLEENEINKLKPYLNEDIYNKEEILDILKNYINTDFEKYFNTYNMDKLNYKIVNNYVLSKNQKTIDECIKNRVKKNDFYKIEEKFNTSTYYLVLSELESKLEILRFNEDSYITIDKLEAEGIKKEDLISYRNFIIKNIGERKFFTIRYLEKNYNLNKFEEFGFEEIFFESIIKSIDRMKKIRFSGTMIFCIRNEIFSKTDFISEVVNRIGTIDIYKLKDLLRKEYGIEITKEDLQQTIFESDLYYDKIIEKIFRNKEEYYMEVYK